MPDNRTRDECLQDIEDAKARLTQLVANDPWVYAIKRTWKGEIRYHTRVKGMGWLQLLARDLDHPGLWLAACKYWAEEMMESMATDHLRTPGARPHGEYEIVRIAKEALPHLPCWGSYKHLIRFGGTP
jgi:hypothetical protein